MQTAENAWKLKTLAQWQTLNNAAPFSGVGGAPYFVLDVSAKTIKLPDTRNMVMTDAGTLISVGASQGDASQNISGSFPSGGRPAGNSGAFTVSQEQIVNMTASLSGSEAYMTITLNAANQIRTATETRPKRFGGLGCVYIGG
jgi:hypothetical protein